MNILGIGQAGCKIAKQFETFPQYNTFFVDTKNEDNYKNFFKIEEQNTHEEYEKNYKYLDLKKIKGATTIVLAGSGKITGILLRLLKQLKEKELKILYVKPDLSVSSEKSILREHLVFGILQQYARSNLLSQLYVVSNIDVESVLEKIFIPTYWKDINNAIVSTYHMLNVYKNTEPLLNTFSEPGITCKIATLGVVNYKTLNEKLFYNLQKPRLKKYYFGVSEKTLNDEKDLLHKIRIFVEDKSKMEEKCTAGFGIFPTNYEQDYIYTVQYASLIQEEKID
jgi:hypothetical protein